MTLTGQIEPIPTDQAGEAQQSDELSVDAETYEQAFVELRTRVPEGWRLLNVRRGE